MAAPPGIGRGGIQDITRHLEERRAGWGGAGRGGAVIKVYRQQGIYRPLLMCPFVRAWSYEVIRTGKGLGGGGGGGGGQDIGFHSRGACSIGLDKGAENFMISIFIFEHSHSCHVWFDCSQWCKSTIFVCTLRCF